MKRTLSTVVFSAALLALTSIASLADATNWLFYMMAGIQATNGSMTFGSQQLKTGTKAICSDGVDISNDSHWTKPTTKSNAGAFIYDTQDPLKPYWVFDIKSPWKGEPYSYWDIYIYTGTTYSSSAITVAWWGLSTYVIPQSNGTIFPAMGIEVMDDPTGTYAQHSTFALNLDGDVHAGNSSRPVGSLTFYDTKGVLKYDAVASYDPQLLVPGHCIRLRVGALPEPGSFAGLGAGLVGFAGFALRCRNSSKTS